MFANQRTAVKLPSEEGKPSHDDDFKAGYKAGKAAYAKNKDISKTDAEKAYKRLSKKHGTWWIDGYTAVIALASGANNAKPALIAKKMGLVK